MNFTRCTPVTYQGGEGVKLLRNFTLHPVGSPGSPALSSEERAAYRSQPLPVHLAPSLRTAPESLCLPRMAPLRALSDASSRSAGALRAPKSGPVIGSQAVSEAPL